MRQVESNWDAEQTGQRGCLQDAEYDRHCINYPAPEWRMNYLASSCEARLVNGTCKNKKCEHWQDKFVEEEKPVDVKTQTVKNTQPHIVKCVCGCDKTGNHAAHGLIRYCYLKAYRSGTIDNFKKKSLVGAKYNRRQ